MIKPCTTRQIPDCDGRKANRLRHRCLLYANEPFLVCAVHPFGPTGDSCLDFRFLPDAENRCFKDFLSLESRTEAKIADHEMPVDHPFGLAPDEELWEPEGASYYASELILQPKERWTFEEQLELLDTHQMFTNKCPACNRQWLQDDRPPVHWDYRCGWLDDSV